MKQQGKILRFWRDVEVFTIPSPATYKDQEFPGPKSSQPKIIVTPCTEPQSLPWDAAIPMPKSLSREHVVYLGVQDTAFLAQKVLQAVAPLADLEEHDLENLTGQGCLAVFRVNQDGVPLAETFTVASFVLGVEAYRTGISLDGLTRRLEDAQRSFDERRFALKLTEDADDFPHAPGTDEPGTDAFDIDTPGTAVPGAAVPDTAENDAESPEPERKPGAPYIPFTWETLREECRLLSDCLGIALPEQLTLVVKTTETPIRKDAKKDKKPRPQPELLNSFYLNDLDTLIRQCDQNVPFGKVLSAYLSPPSDTASRRDILKDPATMLGLLDPSHLPSGRWPSPAKHHLMLGQQAAVSGILARAGGDDGGLVAVNGPPGTGKTTLLSDIIAESVVRRAENICAHDKPWQIFEEKISCAGYTVHPIKKAVARHTGVVVSSNNNSAVENITLDLPSGSKIALDEHPGAAYFNEVIRSVFSRAGIQSPPWGLAAGALGSKSNRKKFYDAFYWGDSDNSTRGMKSILSALWQDASTETAWQAAKDAFLSLKREIDRRKKELGVCHEGLSLHPRLELVEKRLKQMDASAAGLQLEKEACRADIAAADLDKPGLFSRLLGDCGFKSRAYQDWNQNRKEAQQALQAVIARQRDAQTRKNTLLSEKARLESEIKARRDRNSAHQDIGPVPDKHFFEQSPEKRHLSHVWTTDGFDLLRSQYFLAALKVHETTVLACPGRFSPNYYALGTLLAGQDCFTREVRAALWDTLFFTVPVVSTTLASFDRLFNGMDQDSLGWLLIDEAGQATPQSVAGALWRSRRAVVIGDPLQIEPVLTIPEKLAAHIQKKHGLEDAWSPKYHSAQTLADRTMDVGARVGSGENAVWTGLPLRAHRRCTDPMFSVSNHIAYDNQMVQANTKPAGITCCLGESAWFDVQASTSDGQIVDAELRELRELLKKLDADWPLVSDGREASVYIISPFRRVARECGRVAKELKLESMIRTGTVHTFQGREADIVFIVLGSAPGQAGAGSRGWASQKPNILNVALTRAKLLVYVIGNLDDWKSCRGFDWLAKNLAGISARDEA